MKIRRVLALSVFATALSSLAAAQYDRPGYSLFGSKAGASAVRYFPDETYQFASDGGDYAGSATASASTANASGSATADLQSGLLRASALTSHGDSSVRHHFAASGYAAMWDRITIKNDYSTDTLIPLEFEFHGFGQGQHSAEFLYWIGNESYYSQTSQPTWISGQLTLPEPGQEITYSLAFALAVRATSSTHYGGMDGQAEFGNTLHVRWQLPKGVSFTSASGVFNPEPINAVPEPASIMALGAGALAILRRRKSAA